MPNIIEITDFHAPELDPYARLTQNQLRNRLEPEKGIFHRREPQGHRPGAGRRLQARVPADGAQADHRPGSGHPEPLRRCAGVHGRSRAAGGSDGL